MLTTLCRHLPAKTSILLLLCLTTTQSLAASKNQNPVEDLQYANALYHYYLQQPLQSLTRLAINHLRQQQQNPEAQRPLDALLLETVLKLDYGMALSAINLMQQPQVADNLRKTDTLWLHLATVFYDKQLYRISQQALDKVNEPEALRDYAQWLFLKAQIALKQQKDKDTRNYLQQLDDDSIYRIYLQYNLALKAYQQGNSETATQQFDQLLEQLQTPANQEQQLLKDRILITAAYIHFYQKNIEGAGQYFSKLSIDSLFVDEALLGFGKVAAEQEQYALAIQLFERLEQHPLLSNRKIEAMLLLAEIQEKQEDFATALRSYETAERLCEQNQQKLQLMQDYYSAQQLAATMLKFHQQQLQSDEIKALLTDSGFLLDILNDQAFTAQIRNLYDLDQIDKQLATWHQKLPAIHQIMDSKISALQHKKKVIGEQKQQYQDDDVLPRYQAFAKRLEKLEAEKQVFALNSDDEVERQQMITDIENLLPHLTYDPFYDEYVENLRRIKGAIIWQAYDHYHARLWQAKRQLKGLQQALNENQQLTRNLDDLLQGNETLYQYRNNLQQQQQLITEQQAELDTIRQQARFSLKQDFDRAVNNEKNNTLNYLRHARLAIARVSEHFLDEDLLQ